MSKNDKKHTYSKRTNSTSHNNQNIKREEQNESVLHNSNMPNIISQSSLSNNNNSVLMNSSLVSNSSDVTFIKDKGDKNSQKVDCLGKIPTARFGHTMVLVSPVKAVLFGGAVGDTKNFVFSNETYILNLMTKIWLKLETKSQNVPSARAAHAACTNDLLQMVVYGGSTGGGMLASDDLYILDLKAGDEDADWTILPIQGKTPGKRYGHTLCYIKPFIIVFGGNTGSQPLNDVWTIQLEKMPFVWTKIEIIDNQSIPSPRVYHASGICMKGTASGMMIIYGGRDANDSALSDTWGLRRHRDGRWDWLAAPYKTQEVLPKARFNHYVFFLGQYMIVSGGRGKNIQELMPTEVYDTETSEWKRFSSIGLFRHISFVKDNYMFIYGGFENSNPNIPVEKLIKIDLLQYFKTNSNLQSKIEAFLESKKENKSNLMNQSAINNINNSIMESSAKSMKSFIENNLKEEKKFYIANAAVVLKATDNMNAYDDSALLRKVSIDKLTDEAKRIGYNNVKSLVQTKRIYNEQVINKFIEILLRPFDWYNQEVKEIHDNLPFTIEDIDSLLNETYKILSKEPTLVKIKSPAKVFGNLFGQYNDLMRLFESYGHPSDDNAMGDIHLFQYVFLGNYVDRGNYSLEVIFLLFALKVKYPDHIILLRGPHEDPNMNIMYGLAEECENRLKENFRSENSVFLKLNSLFDLLPFAALIDNKILCVHGGIGSSLNKLSDISNIRRPVQIVQDVSTPDQQLILDLIWSEYSDSVNDLAINDERDINKTGFIVKYGRDRLNRFMMENNVALVVTSHMWIAEGVKKFANDKIVVVYSATNYCDKAMNLGGLLNINKYSTTIVPKLIDIWKGDRKSYRNCKNLSPIRK